DRQRRATQMGGHTGLQPRRDDGSDHRILERRHQFAHAEQQHQQPDAFDGRRSPILPAPQALMHGLANHTSSWSASANNPSKRRAISTLRAMSLVKVITILGDHSR